MEREKRRGFDRYYRPIDVWAIAFGCMVGWGAFVMPGTTFLPVAGPAGTLIAMVISVIIILIVGANFSYLMIRRSGTGGVYAYTKEAFGRDHAILCSWFLSLSYLTIVFLNGTALFIVVRTVFRGKLQTGLQYTIADTPIYLREVAVSMSALILIGILFIVAKPFLQKLHTVLALILIAGSVFITLCCLPHVSVHELFTGFGIRGLNRTYAVFTLVVLAPWAFVGFDVIALETVHFRFHVRKTGRIMMLSILLAGFVYTAMTVVGTTCVPDGYASWQEYIADLPNLRGVDSVPTFHAAQTVLGSAGLIVLGITALAAILTGMIAAYRATTRMLSTMAEDRILSEKFTNTPVSILFIMGISIMISFLGNNALTWFVEITSFGAVIGFGYTSAAAMKFAKAAEHRRVQLSGILGTLISIVFVIVQLVPKTTALGAMSAPSFLLLSLWCLLGFLFYWRTVTHTDLAGYDGISVSGTVLFALLMYSVFMWFGKQLLLLDSVERVHSFLYTWGIVLMCIVFAALIIMMYIQNLVRKKHNALEHERIQALERSRAKSRFLFNMSHDIRTPMNAIIGYTKLAIGRNESEEVGDYLEKIDHSSQQMMGLLDDILEMSRVESGKVEISNVPTDIRAMLEEQKVLFGSQMQGKQIDFTVDLEQIEHPFVMCDRRSLQRVLLNIISNSYKFTPSGGAVTVSLREHAAGASGEGRYELRVRDSGIGMSQEFAEKMYTAFERERTSTDSGYHGTGLGLAIMKSLVDLMGGTIEVDTAPGRGTEFIIGLKFELSSEADVREYDAKAGQTAPSVVLEKTGKADARASVAEENKKAAETAADPDGKRILLVEDNQINREIAMMILLQAGFLVETAENGRIAVDMIRDSVPGYFSAVLMDIQMPVMDGYEATREIRALPDAGLSQIPIVALTANAFEEDRREAERAGMQAHLSKPIDIGKMMQVLHDVMGQKE